MTAQTDANGSAAFAPPGCRSRAARTDNSAGPAVGQSIAVFLLLVAVLPLLLIDWSNVQGDSTNIALAWLVIFLSAANIAHIWAIGDPAIVRASFYIFTYIFMGLAVLAQVTANQFPIWAPGTGAYSTQMIRRALIAVLAGIIVFHVSNRVFAAVLRKKGTDRRSQRTPDRIISENAALFLGAVGIVLTAVFIARTGIRPFFESREARTTAQFGLGQDATLSMVLATSKAVGGALRYAAQVPVLVALTAILYKKRTGTWRRGSRSREVFVQCLTFGLVIACLIINNPISNSRFWSGLVIVALGSVLIPFGRPAGIRWAITLALCTLLFAFTTLQAFRYSGGPKDYSQGPRADLVNSATYSAFGMELVGLRWLQTYPHAPDQILGAALVFVPRSIWHGKPGDTGGLILPYYNPAASAWTEGEVEGGLLGIAVVFAAIGVGAEILDRQIRGSRPASPARIIAPIAGGLLIFVLRGSFLPAASPVYMISICMLIVARPDCRPGTVKGEGAEAFAVTRRVGPANNNAQLIRNVALRKLGA